MEFVRKSKTAVLLLASLFVILFLVSPEFTGMVTDTLKVNIGIALSSQGCMYFLNGQTEILENGTMTFDILLENCGNRPLAGNISFVIVNSSGTVINETNSSYYSINTFDYFGYNFTWNATVPLGTYYARARDNYTNETIQANLTFIVTTPYVPTPEQPVPGGGVPAYAPPTHNLSVEAPHSVSVYRGTNRTFLIRVTNTGEAELQRLALIISHERAGIRSAPATVVTLGVNSSVLFFVEIDASETIEGTYELTWSVFTESLNRTGTTEVTVLPHVLKDECGNSVVYYLELMETISEQILSLEREGKNVSYARYLYEETMYQLMAAQTYGEIDEYGKCIERIGNVRENIEVIVLELARAKTEPLLVILPLVYQVITWSLLTLVLVLVAMILARRLSKRYHHHIRKSRLMLPKDWS